MRSNRYLNAVLTIIALELGWIALTHSGVPVSAQAPTRVILAGVDFRAGDEVVPVTVRTPVEVRATVPIPITTNRPIEVRIPVVTSPRPGL